MEIEFFTFSVEAIQISKFDENKAKHDKSKVKTGLSVLFELKISEKASLRFWQLSFFVGNY